MLRESLLCSMVLLNTKCCNHKWPSADACILKETHFFQQWKAIYGFFYCSRSPPENDTCKNNVIVYNQEDMLQRLTGLSSNL